MTSAQIISLVVLVAYMLLCVGIGIYAGRAQRAGTAKEYLTGGGGVGFWINGFAIFAAFATGGTMLGNLGLSYAGGWGYITAYNAGVAVGYLLTTFFLAKVLRNMNVSTIPEFIKARFRNKALNIIVPLVLVVTLLAYLVAQMKVGGMIGERLFGIPYGWSVVLIGVVYVFYTFIGGMKAVTLTDFIQGLLMIGVIVATGAIAATTNGGGLASYDLAQELRPAWTTGSEKYPFVAYLGGFLVWATVNAVLPHTVMRLFAAKDERTGRASLVLGLGLYVLTAFVTVIAIVASTIIITGGADLKNPDETLLIFLETVPPWLMALAFAGIFAAVMSSVSAMLLGLSAAFAYDFLPEVRPSMTDGAKRTWTKYGILVFGLATLLLALNPPALLTLLYSAAMGLLASALFFPTMLGVWWRRMNSIGALAGAVAGGVSYLILLWGFQLPPLSQILISLPISLVACIVGSLASRPPEPRELHRIAVAHEREFVPGEDDYAEEVLATDEGVVRSAGGATADRPLA